MSCKWTCKHERKCMCGSFPCTPTRASWLRLLAEVGLRPGVFIFIVISEPPGWNLFKHLVCDKRQESVHVLSVIYDKDYGFASMGAAAAALPASCGCVSALLWCVSESLRGLRRCSRAQTNTSANTMVQTIVCEKINRADVFMCDYGFKKSKTKSALTSIAVCSMRSSIHRAG